MPISKRDGRRALVGAALLLAVAGCDFLDPTEVTNPSTTTEDLAEASEPTAALLPGLRAQMARAVRGVVQTTALVSDNFEIAFTNVGGELADPYALNPEGASFNSTGGIGAYWNLQELRALADFVVDTIGADDGTATPGQLAEARYYRGMAFLMQGENFVAVPTAPDTEPTPARGLLERAVQDFTAAAGLVDDDELALAIAAALARAHRDLGDATQARSFANQVLAADADFVFLEEYGAGEIENPFSNETRTFQPLPRLDFLDPKYVSRDAGIPLAKAEEMHLILAEAAMSGGDYATGADEVAEAVRIARTRPRASFNDTDQRGNPDLTIRPRASEILVAAEAGAPFRAGLVLDRPGSVTVPTISGTSLNADSVAALTDPQAIRHALWLARQEIMFLEGRRLNDLGVLMPIMQREVDASPVIDEGDPGTSAEVPSYIPENVIDEFSPRSPYVDDRNGGALATDRITIQVDMNRILAEARVSKFGTLP